MESGFPEEELPAYLWPGEEIPYQEVELSLDAAVMTPDTAADGQTEVAQHNNPALPSAEDDSGSAGDMIDGVAGDGAEGDDGDSPDQLVSSNSTLVPTITDYVAADERISIEYDEADFSAPSVSVETVMDGGDRFSIIQVDGHPIVRIMLFEGTAPLTAAEIDLVPASTDLTNNDDFRIGTPDSEHLIGRPGDDTIIGGGGADTLAGWGGDDLLISHGSGGMLSGSQGDDYLEAQKTSYGQYHLYGDAGEDTFVMHLDNESGWGHQGFHAFGGDGADTFQFVRSENANAPLVSRLDDFNPEVDSLWVDDEEIDLEALPGDMRIVNYYDQQWLVIDNNIIIGLEGPREAAPAGVPTMMGSTEEMHFHRFPSDLTTLVSAPYMGQ